MYSSYFLHSTIRFDNDGNDGDEDRKMATKLIDDKVWAACGRSFSAHPPNVLKSKSNGDADLDHGADGASKKAYVGKKGTHLMCVHDENCIYTCTEDEKWWENVKNQSQDEIYKLLVEHMVCRVHLDVCYTHAQYTYRACFDGKAPTASGMVKACRFYSQTYGIQVSCICASERVRTAG